ncbi:hypothetical protein ACFYZ9_33730 [Streptomyces sp. NPDC001691]|uniref:hypothetical protein n=1 Tax=Streptomyces sp. NPDC001691 TaxID=3364600 RepID=UPI0036A0C609
MSTLLIGHYTRPFDTYDEGTLVITSSHQVEDGDQDTIDALVEELADDNLAWAAEFDVDSHKAAVQRAYDVYVHDPHGAEGLVDEVEHVEPTTH